MADVVNVNVDVNELFENLRNRIKAIHSEDELKVIDKAFAIANEYHGDQKRKSGEPYIIHPIAVCDILVDLGMDWQSLVAALLHDVVEDTPYTIEQLTEDFGEEVAVLVDGVTKLGKVSLSNKEEQQAENLRKHIHNLQCKQQEPLSVRKSELRLFFQRLKRFYPKVLFFLRLFLQLRLFSELWILRLKSQNKQFLFLLQKHLQPFPIETFLLTVQVQPYLFCLQSRQ